MARASEPSIHVMLAWPFFEAAGALGLPEDAGRALLGFGERPPGADARVPHELANQLLSWAVELSGRDDLGLLAATRVEPGHFDLVELASRTQRNVGEGLETLAALLPLAHDGLSLHVERGAETSTLSVELADGLSLHPAGHDFIAASLLIAGRRQTGRAELALEHIHLPYPEPADAEYLRTFFATPLSFEARALAIDFPTPALELPLLRGSADLGRVLRQTAEGLLARPRGPTETRTRARIAERLDSDGSDLPAVARALHVSERTLRRRLSDEGVSFRELVDDVRHARAFELFADPDRSTDEVASALGFTTPQALHRAVRRWTGDTLQAFRARARAR